MENQLRFFLRNEIITFKKMCQVILPITGFHIICIIAIALSITKAVSIVTIFFDLILRYNGQIAQIGLALIFVIWSQCDQMLA